MRQQGEKEGGKQKQREVKKGGKTTVEIESRNRKKEAEKYR